MGVNLFGIYRGYFWGLFAHREVARGPQDLPCFQRLRRLVCWRAQRVHVEPARRGCISIALLLVLDKVENPLFQASRSQPFQHANMHKMEAEDVVMRRCWYLPGCRSPSPASEISKMGPKISQSRPASDSCCARPNCESFHLYTVPCLVRAAHDNYFGLLRVLCTTTQPFHAVITICSINRKSHQVHSNNGHCEGATCEARSRRRIAKFKDNRSNIHGLQRTFAQLSNPPASPTLASILTMKTIM